LGSSHGCLLRKAVGEVKRHVMRVIQERKEKREESEENGGVEDLLSNS